ncbi:Uncharacterized protein FKW44_009221, partial [Caligus rogercresseyi]
MSDGLEDYSQMGPERFYTRESCIFLRHRVRILKEWSPMLLKGRVPTVEGDLIDPATNLRFRNRWSSSRLLDGEDRCLRTKSGCQYELVGLPHFKQSVSYPNYVLKGFR